MSRSEGRQRVKVGIWEFGAEFGFRGLRKLAAPGYKAKSTTRHEGQPEDTISLKTEGSYNSVGQAAPLTLD